MKLTALELAGVYRIDIEPHVDERGRFARTFCTRELGELGLDTRIAQMNLSTTARRGTLRGLHWQAAPLAEAKLVRCVRGRIFDVAVDLRSDSPTFRRHAALELGAETLNSIYIPAGCAHGFLTLEDDCEVHYAMSRPYAPEAARGARFDDPAFAITWPEPVRVIAPRDLEWPPFATAGEPPES